MSEMKVAILNMTNGGISGGYKKFLLNVLPRIASDKAINSLLCVSPASLEVNTWFKALPNVEFVNSAPFGVIKSGFNAALKKRLREFSPDLIFVPVARHVKLPGVPVLNMVQNIFPFLRDRVEGLTLKEKLRLSVQYFESVKALRSAKRTIVTSNFVKDLLIGEKLTSEKKVTLVYFGSDQENLNSSKPEIIPENLENKFLFTAGSLESYRGIEDIIAAAGYLKNDFPGLKTVIAGEARPEAGRYRKKLLEMARSRGLENSFIWAGKLSRPELAWCYSNCGVFLMTSRMETFGLIALEAMSNGCVCIAAGNPPLPEIFRDCAYYYPPKDPFALAGAVKEVLNLSREKKREMADKSKERAGYFSWDKTAAGLIREFKAVL